MNPRPAVRALAPALLASTPGLAVALPYLPFLSPFDLYWIDAPYGLRLDGAGGSDRAGHSVASAGDINGDGIDDLIIGAPYANPPSRPDAGRTYVVFGASAIEWVAPIGLSTLNGANGFVINGVASGDESGAAVSSAGDVNGDGFDDLVIGARRVGDYYAQGESIGAAYVVFGGPTVGASGSIELSSLNGTNGFVCNGIDAYDRCGSAVSSAGDVNGDGYDDILVGAPLATPVGRTSAGETYVVFGGPSVGASGSIDMSSLNGTVGFVCIGAHLGDSSGRSVASVGDFNADGVDDIAIGANFSDPGGRSSAGETAVIFGAVGIGASGSLDLGTLNGANGFTINGIAAQDRSGSAIAGARDVNGDGYPDVVIGAPGADPGGRSSAGEAYVVFGGPAVGASGSVELSSLSGANGFIIPGIDPTDECGGAVAITGDANADGHCELLIGARFGDPEGRTDAGESYLIFGGPGVGASGSASASALNGANGVVFQGADAFDGAAFAVGGAGDINDDGIHDFILGAPSADPNSVSGAGEVSVILGRAAPPAPACPGDVNGDTFTNSTDFNILASFFGGVVSPYTNGDLSGDGHVNSSDFNILAGDFGCGAF